MKTQAVQWMFFSPKIIGGSERESDYNKLMTRIDEMHHIPIEEYVVSISITRKPGTCPHPGSVRLGFERLLG